jgi:hypothetical protein
MIHITYAITFVGSLQELMLIKIVARTLLTETRCDGRLQILLPKI